MDFLRRGLAGAIVLGVAAAGLTTLPATAAPVQWTDCKPEGNDDPAEVKGSECATLQLPVDWRNPGGPTFGLALARRKAAMPSERVGVLVFGPGGPGDSGVDRVKTGIDRFSPDLQDRFDIVSFDPRGIARSNPVKCSAELLNKQPSPIIKNAAEFTATISYNRQLATDCREHTGPLYDHIDSWQTVRDVDAVRRALGESTISFHGSSYGTLLGAQYAETYPHRVRAMVLESVIDHSSPTTRAFLDDQGSAGQDSFDEFVEWCDTTTSCALHGRDIHALWADLLAKSPDPFTLSYTVFRRLYGPQWPALAELLKAGGTPPKQVHTGVAPYPLAVFCQDWNLPVRDYREYAAHLQRLARNNQDLRYPGQLMAVSICLGAPPADNPQHLLKVRELKTPVLLANAVHDPATGYNLAQSVERQLGRYGVLLTYEGWGHGSYTKSPCMQSTIDDYLIARDVPERGSSCAAVPPTG
ncbi:alpha/beta fold hydrolase [Kribbella shirazensis]|uniref:Pimeloyl-ACP methyl ester carboxylesterase n=1 Tax=Kribbella shirazensis TaxID=1105143 RepID=A0A7X5V7J6_9ACTN|nr:alpha/beta fold hydrolase [Kribbella shirazensis]NIK56052.1 pimeloyl-ACP methyl ester carboxylesterase [Kribbella shirazensis]